MTPVELETLRSAMVGRLGTEPAERGTPVGRAIPVELIVLGVEVLDDPEATLAGEEARKTLDLGTALGAGRWLRGTRGV